MIEIEPGAYGALEREAGRKQLARFVAWWRARSLPPADDAYLAQLWRYAGDRAREIGIDDDERGQVSLYAAAFGLMGEMDAAQFLHVSDILFLDESQDARLAQIVGVSRSVAVG